MRALQGVRGAVEQRDRRSRRARGTRLITAPLPAGTAIVCQVNYIALAVRRDAAVDFSNDARFTVDAVAARVTMRVDYAPSDSAAFYVLKMA